MTMRLAKIFSGYLWATWTTMEAQPMQTDPALQAMIDQAVQKKSGQTGPSYDLGTSVDGHQIRLSSPRVSH